MNRTIIIVIATSLAWSSAATAEPERCSALKPRRFAQLTDRQQDRLSSGAYWEQQKKPGWKDMVVEVQIERAPHLASEILKTCPDVKVEQSWPLDPRRFTSTVRIKVTSFASLTRLAQLPAVKSIVARSGQRRHHHDDEFIDFEF